MAYLLLEEMQDITVETNTVIFNSVAKSFSYMRLWQKGEELFENIKQQLLLPDSISYTSLMHAMATAWQRALLLLSELPGSVLARMHLKQLDGTPLVTRSPCKTESAISLDIRICFAHSQLRHL